MGASATVTKRMTPLTRQKIPIKLSICIATFNRAAFLGDTLDAIFAQATDECEVVVCDDASTDDTEKVIQKYARRSSCLTYVKQGANVGLDRNFDYAILKARGEYCWLMTDDDLLKPDAVRTVMEALHCDPSLVVVNCESKDLSMSKVITDRWLKLDGDCVYHPGEMDRMVFEAGYIMPFVGCIILKRNIWLEREKTHYFGSLYVHLGVILQKELPGVTVIVARPLVSYRMGNTKGFSSRIFEIVTVRLPELVWSLPISDQSKNKICRHSPWRSTHELFRLRALGAYSFKDYKKWIRPRTQTSSEAATRILIAVSPVLLINYLMQFYYVMFDRKDRHMWLHDLRTFRSTVKSASNLRRIAVAPNKLNY